MNKEAQFLYTLCISNIILLSTLAFAIAKMPSTQQRSHVEAQIPNLIAFGLKSLDRSN